MKRIPELDGKRPVILTIVAYLASFLLFTAYTWNSVVDKAVYFRLFIVVSCFMVYAFYLTVRQFREVIRPKSWLTGLRLLILLTLVLTTITFIPSIFNLYFTAIGERYEVLRTASVLIGSLNLVGSTVFLVLIYTYKKKDD